MLTRQRVLVILLVLSICCSACQAAVRRPLGGAAAGGSPVLEELLNNLDGKMLQQHVAELTSAVYGGRAVGTSGERRAANYLTNHLANWQLEPWHDLGLAQFCYDFVVPDTDTTGRNIIAVRKGRTRNWLLLVAHYDHLGIKQGQLYPGADDNAVAVAILLEIARCLALLQKAPSDNVALVFTSGEERRLSGSKDLARRLVASQLAQRCRVVNLDMLGGTGGNSLDVWREQSRPTGKELASQVRRAIQASGGKSNLVKRRFAGVDSRSFARAGIPSITLSWAYQARFHPHRHQPADSAEQLRPEIMQKAARGVIHVIHALAYSDS